jgi:hypothetical protein
MRRTDPKTELKICNEYLICKNAYQLSKTHLLDIHTVYRILKRNGIEVRRTKLSLEQELELCRSYGKLSCDKICSVFDIDRPTIYRILRKYGVYVKNKSEANIRKRKVNYFSTISDEWQAYFLGLIFSDGNLHKNMISIGLVESDFYIVKKVCEKLFEVMPKFYRSIKTITNSKGETIKCKPQLCLSFSDMKFVGIMRDVFGLHSNKSLNCNFPKNIPDQFIHHFVRGYFDGDGCIKSDLKSVTILGSRKFLTALKNVLVNNGIRSVYVKPREGNRIFTLNIFKSDDIDSFGKFIYNKDSISLNRKKDKFLTRLKIKENSNQTDSHV